jgi:hypothetical protein
VRVARETFQAGDLTAVIGDNEAYDGRRAGYNGVHSLIHKTRPESLFGIAGLNYEHIFDGLQELTGEPKVYFEPRNFPITLTKISDVEAELHQAPTPTFFLESWTRFKLVAPHYIDFSYRCKPHQHAFRNGYIGVFWASYIDAPENKSIYFRDDKGWVQLCTQAHNDESTVRHVDDKFELKVAPGMRDTLYRNYFPLLALTQSRRALEEAERALRLVQESEPGRAGRGGGGGAAPRACAPWSPTRS